MNVVEVVAGVIFDNSGRRVLLALRKPDQHQGNKWEFPGGKLKADEAPLDGLKRELLEEIGIVPTCAAPRRTLEHRYKDKHVRLRFFDVTEYDGEPCGMEGQQLRWVALGELALISFPEANQVIVEDLLQLST